MLWPILKHYPDILLEIRRKIGYLVNDPRFEPCTQSCRQVGNAPMPYSEGPCYKYWTEGQIFWGSWCFFSIPQDKFRNRTSSSARTFSLHALSHSLITSHSLSFKASTVWSTDSFVKQNMHQTGHVSRTTEVQRHPLVWHRSLHFEYFSKFMSLNPWISLSPPPPHSPHFHRTGSYGTVSRSNKLRIYNFQHTATGRTDISGSWYTKTSQNSTRARHSNLWRTEHLLQLELPIS
jgi:hypothetical protein